MIEKKNVVDLGRFHYYVDDNGVEHCFDACTWEDLPANKFRKRLFEDVVPLNGNCALEQRTKDDLAAVLINQYQTLGYYHFT